MTFDPLGSSSPGYQVYPDKLRKAADEVAHAAELTQAFADVDLSDIFLGVNDLGMPGRATEIIPGVAGLGTVDRYNQAMTQIIELARGNAGELTKLSAALQQTAGYYEQLDAEAYERLKKIEGGLK